MASDRTRVLIDAGISGRETARRLQSIGVEPDALDAICVTHEHTDHTAALRTLRQRHALELYANSGTIEGIERQPNMQGLPWQIFSTGNPFEIGDLTIVPFSVPHDAYDPVGFLVQHEGLSLGLATDMGMPTTLIRDRLAACSVLVVESNHDPSLLQDAKRPWHLKQRVAGRHGHLSNVRTAELLVDIAGPPLTDVFLAHISQDCNRPELALSTVRNALEQAGHRHVNVRLTYPDRSSEVWQTG